MSLESISWRLLQMGRIIIAASQIECQQKYNRPCDFNE
ncbi:hypothetical protein AM1_0438 [Acaryochloris marina MBIC11017]|uniref:Uncharacterized protein n=1 Tax=Acaryochloris marina (strain MBIC 11017) TaxID=329726 RepID=B0CB04_ACAM1|nr:hypothetical protein AM1_0438 [Acaryochloris marina MBIC11017]